MGRIAPRATRARSARYTTGAPGAPYRTASPHDPHRAVSPLARLPPIILAASCMSDAPNPPPVPAVLRLVQTVVAGRWRATGEELYREVASLVEAAQGKEIVVVGCGDGVTVEWMAARTSATVTGIDADKSRIERAERRRRTAAASAQPCGPPCNQTAPR